MMLSATFNNILVTSWRSVSLVEETEYPDKPYHIMLYRVHTILIELCNQHL